MNQFRSAMSKDWAATQGGLCRTMGVHALNLATRSPGSRYFGFKNMYVHLASPEQVTFNIVSRLLESQ